MKLRAGEIWDGKSCRIAHLMHHGNTDHVLPLYSADEWTKFLATDNGHFSLTRCVNDVGVHLSVVMYIRVPCARTYFLLLNYICSDKTLI